MKSARVPIFGCRLYFFDSVEDCAKYTEKNGWLVSHHGAAGICARYGQEIVVAVNDPKNMGIIAHEAFHAAGEICRYAGIRSRDEELLAYLTEWVVNRAVTAFGAYI